MLLKMNLALLVVVVLLTTSSARNTRKNGSNVFENTASANNTNESEEHNSLSEESNENGDSVNNKTVDIPNLLKLLSEFSGANRKLIQSTKIVLNEFQNTSLEVRQGILILYALNRSNQFGNNSFEALSSFTNSLRDYIRNLGKTAGSAMRNRVAGALDNINAFLNKSSGAFENFIKGVNNVSAEDYNNVFNNIFTNLREGLTEIQNFRPRFPYVVLSSTKSLMSQLRSGRLNSSIENILINNPQFLSNTTTPLHFSELIQLLERTGTQSARMSASLISNQIWNFLNMLGSFFGSMLGSGGNGSMTTGGNTGSVGGNFGVNRGFLFG